MPRQVVDLRSSHFVGSTQKMCFLSRPSNQVFSSLPGLPGRGGSYRTRNRKGKSE